MGDYFVTSDGPCRKILRKGCWRYLVSMTDHQYAILSQWLPIHFMSFHSVGRTRLASLCKNMPSAESDRFQRVYNINRLLILVVSVSFETGDSLERTGCKQCHVKTWSISGISFQTTKWPQTKWNKVKDTMFSLTSSCPCLCLVPTVKIPIVNWKFLIIQRVVTQNWISYIPLKRAWKKRQENY